MPNPKCTAKSSRTGKQCQRDATPGTNVCASHGSRAPQVKAKAVERLREARLIDDLARFGVPIETTPQDAMLKTLYAAAGRVAWLRRRIVEYTEAHGTVISVETLAGGQRVGGDDLNGWPEGDGGDGSGNPALLVIERPSKDAIRLSENPLLAMLRTEEKHLVDVASACHKAGIEQARIDLHQTVADLLVGALARALPELGVTADEDHVIDVVSRSLVAIG